jgi:hypothetical protein
VSERSRDLEQLERRIAEIEQHLIDDDDVRRNRATQTCRARHAETLKIFRTRKRHGL